MPNLPIRPLMVTVAAATCLALIVTAPLPATDGPAMIVKATSIGTLADRPVTEGEDAPVPVDFDGDGLADREALLHAALGPEPLAADADAGEPLILRLTAVPCPGMASAKAPDATVWLLVAADENELPSAIGAELRIQVTPVPDSDPRRPRTLVIETAENPGDHPALPGALPDACVRHATVLS